MTKDRLQELRGFQIEDEDDIVFGVEEKSRYMGDFFEEVDLIRENIENIQTIITAVKETQSAILSAPQTDARLKQQLQDLLADIKRTANRVRGKLKSMERDCEELEKIPYRVVGAVGTDLYPSADFRMRKTQHSILSQMFVQVMNEYNRTQMDHKEGLKDRIKRQLEITGRHIPEEEFDTMIESGDLNIFTQDIITDTQIAKQILADIEARHEDIMKLENSVKELHELFNDLAFLTETQGEMIDRIEYHIDQADQYIRIALPETEDARKRKKKQLRKRIMMSFCLFIMVLVLISIVSGILF